MACWKYCFLCFKSLRQTKQYRSYLTQTQANHIRHTLCQIFARRSWIVRTLATRAKRGDFAIHTTITQYPVIAVRFSRRATKSIYAHQMAGLFGHAVYAMLNMLAFSPSILLRSLGSSDIRMSPEQLELEDFRDFTHNKPEPPSRVYSQSNALWHNSTEFVVRQFAKH